MRRALPILVAVLAVAAVVVPYVALGGASYEPTPVADPCQARPWRNPAPGRLAIRVPRNAARFGPPGEA